jgi:hypothetical protein
MKQQSEGRAMNALSALEPFARAWRSAAPDQERCGVCARAIDEERHEHLVDLESRALLCACPTCGTTFAQPGAGGRKLRLVPTRVAVDPGFRLDDAQWTALAIPVRLAFIFFNSRLARWVALYPSPGGAAEADPPPAALEALAAATRLIAEIEPDVEALLVYGRRGGPLETFLAPVDACYRLVGEVRRHWQGFSGGDLVWSRIETFFAELRARATALGSGDAS